jgi:hypothetical protein
MDPKNPEPKGPKMTTKVEQAAATLATEKSGGPAADSLASHASDWAWCNDTAKQNRDADREAFIRGYFPMSYAADGVAEKAIAESWPVVVPSREEAFAFSCAVVSGKQHAPDFVRSAAMVYQGEHMREFPNRNEALLAMRLALAIEQSRRDLKAGYAAALAIVRAPQTPQMAINNPAKYRAERFLEVCGL